MYLCISSAASLKRGGQQEAILLLRGKTKVCSAATASSKLQPAPQPHRNASATLESLHNVDNVRVCWSTQSHDVTSRGWPYCWVVKSAAGGRSFPSDHCLVAKRQSLIWKEREKKNRNINISKQDVTQTLTGCRGNRVRVLLHREEGLIRCSWQHMTAMTHVSKEKKKWH